MFYNSIGKLGIWWICYTDIFTRKRTYEILKNEIAKIKGVRFLTEKGGVAVIEGVNGKNG